MVISSIYDTQSSTLHLCTYPNTSIRWPVCTELIYIFPISKTMHLICHWETRNHTLIYFSVLIAWKLKN
jgi:hypothetical protein